MGETREPAVQGHIQQPLARTGLRDKGESPMPADAASLPTKAPARAAKAALVWTLAFIACHVYWYLGGQVGFGDQPVASALPGRPSSVGGWIFTVVTGGMWVAGLVVPSALAWSWGRRLPRRLLVGLMWAGALVLLARGGSGWVDDAVRFSGLYDGGLTGLSTKDLLGRADPTTYTKLSTAALDSVFVIGGVLFAYAARLAGSASRTADTTGISRMWRNELPRYL